MYKNAGTSWQVRGAALALTGDDGKTSRGMYEIFLFLKIAGQGK